MNQTNPIRILIVDDHAMVRSGLKNFIYGFEWMEPVGEAADGAAAVDFCAQHEVDVVLMDMIMPQMDGSEATRRIMALGKPVLCYIRESDLKFIPQEMRKDLPIIKATPSTIYSVLKEWLTVRRDELSKVGQSSRAYVEKWHDPVKIAARLKSEYEAILANCKSRREGSKIQGSLK